MVETKKSEKNKSSKIPVDVDHHSQIVDEKQPEWNTFKKEKIKASIEAGEIIPELKMRKNAIYIAKLLSVPKYIKSKKGNFFIVEIAYGGMTMSLKANQSFLFDLAKYEEVEKCTDEDTVGKMIKFWKNEEGFVSLKFIK